MITIIGANRKQYNLEDNSNAILLEPRIYHDSCIIGYNPKEDRFLYVKQHFNDNLENQGMTEDEAHGLFNDIILGTCDENYPFFLDLEDASILCFDGYDYVHSDWIMGEFCEIS